MCIRDRSTWAKTDSEKALARLKGEMERKLEESAANAKKLQESIEQQNEINSSLSIQLTTLQEEKNTLDEHIKALNDNLFMTRVNFAEVMNTIFEEGGSELYDKIEAKMSFKESYAEHKMSVDAGVTRLDSKTFR
eukprot:TRINITY_DN4767_c0_g1_i4.p1 TRINITY_DN4767_c0_g1~~TRINITY_DN4767_c0_g1_i4.p1  ORF type:complete len:135 (-),score=42.43 TRINITY_DN4767_c0_g1_i4:98-502(-)